MTSPVRRALLWLAASYIVLMPTTEAKPVRIVLWITGALLGIAAIAYARRQREEMVPMPGAPVVGLLAFWMGWSILSVLWSPRPAFTLEELRNEVLNNAVLIAIYYYVALDGRAIRTLVAATICGFVLHAVAILGVAPHIGDLDPFRWHYGVVWVATWLTLTAPFLALPLFPRPLGWGGGAKTAAFVAVLFALMLCLAVATENRMIWIAFGVEAFVLLAFTIRRWPEKAAFRRGRIVTAVVIGGALLLAGFVWTLNERVPKLAPETADVASTLRKDPRFDLWSRSLQTIAEHPWLGHGFGKGIASDEMVRTMRNPLLWHPHNVFLSQWQQTGLIGMAAVIGLFIALGHRMVRFMRSRDDAVALTGAIGLAVLLGFLLKNMTDDFMVRGAAKEFWAYTAMLLGYGVHREHSLARRGATAPAIPAAARQIA